MIEFLLELKSTLADQEVVVKLLMAFGLFVELKVGCCDHTSETL